MGWETVKGDRVVVGVAKFVVVTISMSSGRRAARHPDAQASVKLTNLLRTFALNGGDVNECV